MCPGNRVIILSLLTVFATQPGGMTPVAMAQESPSQPAQGGEQTLEYLISPGDSLNISVWKEPDFSGVFRVRFDGRITLPLAGDIDASGRTPMELSKFLEKELTRFIEFPQVTVGIEETSAKFFVIGRVSTQGAFPYTGPLRVVQALALAGGFQDFAKRGNIFVIREVNGKQIQFPVHYDRIEDGRDLETYNFQLLPGDTIVVP
jgi:polysaccharide export outer membrane protein